jgi:hypothetical protein
VDAPQLALPDPAATAAAACLKVHWNCSSLGKVITNFTDEERDAELSIFDSKRGGHIITERLVFCITQS